MKRVILAICSIILAQSVSAQGLPTFEFAIGPGFMAYGIDCQYTDPAGTSAVYGDGHIMTDWDNVDPSTAWDIAATYPADEKPFALNTLLLLRLPIINRLSIALSNRVAFAFDHIVHREDRYGDSEGLVMTLAGVTGAELEFCFRGDSTGPWIGAFGGLSVLNQPFVKNYFTQFGFGAGGTVGWRMSKSLAFELNSFYFSTAIPDFTVEKITDLDSSLSLSGEASGFAVTAGIRLGF